VGLITVYNLADIPVFKNEGEEAEWWRTHELSEELWDQLPEAPDFLPATRAKTIPCPACADPAIDTSTCLDCDGTGRVHEE
jgi:hypothetical protein